MSKKCIFEYDGQIFIGDVRKPVSPTAPPPRWSSYNLEPPVKKVRHVCEFLYSLYFTFTGQQAVECIRYSCRNFPSSAPASRFHRHNTARVICWYTSIVDSQVVSSAAVELVVIYRELSTAPAVLQTISCKRIVKLQWSPGDHQTSGGRRAR